MNWARILGWLVFLSMLGLGANVVIHGSLDQGLGMDRFLAGLADPWTMFIGFDLMAGLLLAAGWIGWRQHGERLLDTIAWIGCLIWWGNIVVAAYLLIALAQSGGDPARFFMGARAGELRRVWPSGSWLIRLIALVGAALVAIFAIRKIALLELSGLPGQAYVPGFAPVVLALVLLAIPTRKPLGG